MIGLDRTLCNLEKHVVLDDDKVSLTTYPPEECDWIGFEPDHADSGCLRTLFRLENEPLDISVPEKYSNLALTLGKDRSSAWDYVHPSRRLWWATSTLKSTCSTLVKLKRSYHHDVFAPTSALFEQLRAWRVGERFTSSNDPTIQACDVVDGWLEPPEYDRFGTRTGRLTVSHGPPVLTMRQSTRHLLAPLDANHVLVSFDFVALEARVALAIAGKPVPTQEDPYETIATLMRCASRDDAKSATFSALYSDPTESSRRDPRVAQARRVFRLGEVFVELKAKLIEDGVARNRYGRMIVDPSIETLYNNHIQSTAADVALLGFLALLDSVDIVPHFLVHDALFASVPKRFFTQISAVAAHGVNVLGFDEPFPIKATLVGSAKV